MSYAPSVGTISTIHERLRFFRTNFENYLMLVSGKPIFFFLLIRNL